MSLCGGGPLYTAVAETTQPRTPRVKRADPATPITCGGVLRLGGVAALLSGAVFLTTIGYTFGFLASRGLTVEMLDQPAQFLPWIARNRGAYLGLWWLYLGSLLLLLAVPFASTRLGGLRGSALSLLGAVAGSGGAVLGMAGVAVNVATAPLLATGYAAAGSDRDTVLLLSELFGGIGLELRLFGDLLVGVWLAAFGLALLRGTAQRVLPAGLLLGASGVLVVAVAKPLGWFDGEPALGLLLALLYLWIGAMLLHASRSASPARPTRPA